MNRIGMAHADLQKTNQPLITDRELATLGGAETSLVRPEPSIIAITRDDGSSSAPDRHITLWAARPGPPLPLAAG
jgi:hypothetical protein